MVASESTNGGSAPLAAPPPGALIAVADLTLLLEASHPGFEAARQDIARFAELVKTPQHVHTYKLTRLSLWNGAAAGLAAQEVEQALARHARYPVPQELLGFVRESFARYGRLRLVPDGQGLALVSEDDDLLELVAQHRITRGYVARQASPGALSVNPTWRGHLKKALLDIGYPAEDLAGYQPGEALALALRSTTLAGQAFALRDYQREAVAAWWRAGQPEGGAGALVLPCGAGKTVIGLAAIAAAGQSALIVCTNVIAARQWIREILDKTSATPDMVGEYNGEVKQVRPITVATYQVLCWRPDKRLDEYPHMRVFNERDWGLVVYDEVHLLPAPVFRVTAEIQAKRRLGLTATLVREDGHEGDVFSLIGPKRFDAPWRDMEAKGWIAEAHCTEVRVPLPEGLRRPYAIAPERQRFRLASENPAKAEVVRALAAAHRQDRVLVIGQYLDQLKRLAAELRAPLILGATPNRERERLFQEFRAGAHPVLVVSRVANFAIDLPEANVAVEVSGTWGSRQEEAQRLGRILRPKRDGSHARFYALVTPDTVEEDFAHHRQLFLAEQGYPYEVRDARDLLLPAAPAGPPSGGVAP